MSWLSKEAEKEIKKEVASTLSDFLANYQKPKPRLTGLISINDLQEELGVKYNTIMRWEREGGLKRYQAPLEDSRKIYYKISEIMIFMGVK